VTAAKDRDNLRRS